MEELEPTDEDGNEKPAQQLNEPEEEGLPDLVVQEEVKEEAPKVDYSLLDQLIDGFCETAKEDMLPVLCGYFNKILTSLLSKERHRMLDYLLLKREGAIFDALMQHIDHHSLALLLIELLNIKIKPEAPAKKGLYDHWETTSDQDANEENGADEGTLTPEQEQMAAVLEKKAHEIVLRLLDALSYKNDDLEKTLNANAILLDFCDNDHCFAMLTSPEVLQKLIRICCQGGSNERNLPYALNLLSTIINEFSNAEKEISDERKLQIQQLFTKYFTDMAYNCVVLLVAPSEAGEYTNQTNTVVQRIGFKRLRAMELLKTLFVTLSKMKDGKDLVSPILRVKVIDTILHMIRTYPFCCHSHQQCIIILNALKESLDQDDIATLKHFILKELDGQANFEFPSGRTTSGMNMGQITQIAFELRYITQQAIDDECSEEEEEPDAEKLLRRDEIGQWQHFCKTKINKIEKVWNRKLDEDYSDDERDITGRSDEDEDQSHEDTINALLERSDFHRLSRSQAETRRSGNEQERRDLQAVADSLRPLSKDDTDALPSDLGAKEEFA